MNTKIIPTKKPQDNLEANILVAGLGIAPSLRDYEPRVQLYTTPHAHNYYTRTIYQEQLKNQKD